MPEQTVDLGYRPRPWQAKFHREARRFSVAVCHRRAGKTVLALRHIEDRALRLDKPNGRYAYIAPQFNQAKAVAWEYLKGHVRALPGVRINESECWVELPNGSRIRIYGADNPDAMRGLYFDGAVLDEVAQMDPVVWGEIIRPALADRQGWALFIGTPDGVNLFSEIYFSAHGKADWYTCLLTVYDTNAIVPSEIEDARRSMSEAQFAQEFLCDFAAGNEASLLSVHQVTEAMRRNVREEAYQFAPKVIGVDVARFGGDRSCVIRRQGLACFEPAVFRGKEGFELADIVARGIVEWRPDAVFVDDTGGYGGTVIERLRQMGHQVFGVQFAGKPSDERYLNKRAEMWIDMAQWVKDGGALPNNPELRSDLCAPTYKHNAAGKFQLESKEDMKKRGMPSPDIGDALALTFASPVVSKSFRRDSVADADRFIPTIAQYNPIRRR
jgi:hypothetical protein